MGHLLTGPKIALDALETEDAGAYALLCPCCYWVGIPSVVRSGSVLGELLLWVAVGGGGSLLALFSAAPALAWTAFTPGLVYSVWRLRSRRQICPKCGSALLVPEDQVYPPTCSHFLFCVQRPQCSSASVLPAEQRIIRES